MLFHFKYLLLMLFHFKLGIEGYRCRDLCFWGLENERLFVQFLLFCVVIYIGLYLLVSEECQCQQPLVKWQLCSPWVVGWGYRFKSCRMCELLILGEKKKGKRRKNSLPFISNDCILSSNPAVAVFSFYVILSYFPFFLMACFNMRLLCRFMFSVRIIMYIPLAIVIWRLSLFAYLCSFLFYFYFL